MAEILIVDDERSLREGLKKVLHGEGFDVRTARNGDDALAKIDERKPDLVLLDVMMPKMNGFCCCQEIRKMDALLPVVFLTAKDSESEQVRGIGLGADDFVSKSAPDAILLARINRALARSKMMNKRIDEAGTRVLHLGPVTVDLKTNAVIAKNKTISFLTRTEADILNFLYSRRGERVSVDDIVVSLRGRGFACVDTMIYVHFFNLRKKLGPAGNMVSSKRGVGYTLAVE